MVRDKMTKEEFKECVEKHKLCGARKKEKQNMKEGKTRGGRVSDKGIMYQYKIRLIE